MGRRYSSSLRQLGLVAAYDSLRRAAEAMADAIEENVDDGRGVEREHLAKKKSSNHGDAQRTTQLRAHALTQSQRKTRQQSSHGGHHDGAEAQQAGIIDCIRCAFSVLSFALHRKVDHHNSILL